MATNFKTYAEAEMELVHNGFKMEAGMPLTGVRFSNGHKYCYVLRLADFNYEIITV